MARAPAGRARAPARKPAPRTEPARKRHRRSGNRLRPWSVRPARRNGPAPTAAGRAGAAPAGPCRGAGPRGAAGRPERGRTRSARVRKGTRPARMRKGTPARAARGPRRTSPPRPTGPVRAGGPARAEPEDGPEPAGSRGRAGSERPPGRRTGRRGAGDSRRAALPYSCTPRFLVPGCRTPRSSASRFVCAREVHHGHAYPRRWTVTRAGPAEARSSLPRVHVTLRVDARRAGTSTRPRGICPEHPPTLR